MKFSAYLPKSLKRLNANEKVAAMALGTVAVGSVLYWFNRQKSTSPRSPGSRMSVAGAWTDLAVKLGMSIGADMDVKTAQRYLNAVSNAGLAVDGVLGKNTSTAIRNFQRGNGIPESGVIDAETGNALTYLASATSKNPLLQKAATIPPFKGGVWHDLVAKVPSLGAPFTDTVKMSIMGAQKALNTLMPDSTPPSGKLDPPTVSAIKLFQQQQQLPMTGKLDPETSNALLYLATAANPAMHPAASSSSAPVDAPVTYSPALMPPLQQQAPHFADIATSGSTLVGIQSTTMYDPRFQYGF